MPGLPRPEFLNVHDATRYLRIHPQTLARLIRRGEVPVQLHQGRYVVRREELYRRLHRDKPS